MRGAETGAQKGFEGITGKNLATLAIATLEITTPNTMLVRLRRNLEEAVEDYGCGQVSGC